MNVLQTSHCGELKSDVKIQTEVRVQNVDSRGQELHHPRLPEATCVSWLRRHFPESSEVPSGQMNLYHDWKPPSFLPSSWQEKVLLCIQGDQLETHPNLHDHSHVQKLNLPHKIIPHRLQRLCQFSED